MMRVSQQARIEYGDFQTPVELAKKVCQKLADLGVSPDGVLEPTCGVGAFIEAAAALFPQAKSIVGVEINGAYLAELEKNKPGFSKNQRITFAQGDFFDFNWHTFLKDLQGSLLVIGNFPWVTNSQQGAIGGVNLPEKLNFQNRRGLDALTGKSNFDISEWMLIQASQWLENRQGYLAMLCKTAVARKFLKYLHSKQVGLLRSVLYRIDARQYFGAAVEACLLFCEFDQRFHNYDYDIYESLDSPCYRRVGHRHGMTVSDLEAFERLSGLYGNSEFKWRSGIKHDCAEVMELRESQGGYANGLGEIIEIEPTYLFPLLKGSDIANQRTSATQRYVLVTQDAVGGPTDAIRQSAPKTWAYLESHARYLDSRKSRIYQDNPRFSIFGVGPYTFKPYKVAICGLYKNLNFRLVGPIHDRPVVFDDTVYFLSFDTEEAACKALALLTSPVVKDFYSALIFWDEKRPIKTSILNSLNLPLVETAQPRLF